MELNEYQELAERTRSEHHPFNDVVLNCVLGLTGEAGEVADHVKKWYFHGHMMDRTHLVKELGDILWYLSTLASTLECTLDQVAVGNIEKLRKRYPDGFSTEASLNRTE